MNPISALPILDAANASADTSAVLGITLGSFALAGVLYVWTALALSAVFGKSGVPAWKAWVPFLNTIELLQLGGLSGWLVLLVLFPPALWVVVVIACYRVNVSFGLGVGMTVLAALSLPIWATVLGFGSARWIGTPAHAAGPAPGPRRGADGPFGTSAFPAADPLARRLGGPIDAPPPASPSVVSSFAPDPSPVEEDSAPAPAPLPVFTPAPPPSGRADDDGFDLGAVGELTSGATDAVPGAPAPVSAIPTRTAEPALPPVSSVPLASFAGAPGGQAPAATPPVTRVPAAAHAAVADEPWAPRRSAAGAEPDASPFSEASAEVSAIAGAPDAGSPQSARGSVSAQHTRPEIPDEPLDQTILTRRKRTAWSLVPPTGTAVPIGSHVVILGRKPSADAAFPGAQLIPVDDGTVSKTHARLELREDRWYITDLGSTNGVLFATLMGTEIEATPGVEVEAGERFYLGDAEVRLRRSDG
ncbi:MAG: DUF5684 domain-containing protein [Microbacterium pygmaeum]